MINKRPLTIPFSYIFCISVTSFTHNINSFFLKKLFIQSDISYTAIDLMGTYQIFGYIIAPAILIVASEVFSPLKVIIFSVTIYIISSLIVSHLLFLPGVINYCAMIMAGSNFITVILLLGLLVTGSYKNKVNPGYLIFSSWVWGYLLGEIAINFLADFIQDHFIFSIISVIFLGLIILNVLVDPEFRLRILGPEARFGIIIRNMRLESLTVFVIFYIVILISDGYDYYALIEHLLVFISAKESYFAYLLMPVIVYLTQDIYRKFNLYKIKLFCLCALLGSLIAMPIWGRYYLISSIMWVFIGNLLYALFCSVILILKEKFEKKDLYLAVLIASFMGSLGFFAGYTVSRKSEYSADESGFLYSLCVVVFSLIIYYLLSFKKDKLIRR